jgi:hypothetical protein
MGRARVIFWLNFVRRLVVGGVLLYVAVSLTLGGTRTARPAMHGLLGLWLVILSVGTARAWSNRLLDVVATNIAASLVLAELTLAIAAPAVCGSPLVQCDLDAYRLEPGRDYGRGLRGNRLGYPGPELPADKPPGVLRIAALGDSFAVGPVVPFADNYLTRLAHELPGVEVGNFGVSGAGPREYLAILQRDVWAARPDVVLLSVFVGNDITEALPRPRWLDPRRHALFLMWQRGWAVARERRRTESTAPLSPETFQQIEGRRLAVCLKQPPPGMDRKWRQALADLDRLVRACRARRVPLAVVLIPDEFQVNDTVLAEALAVAGVGRDRLDLEGPQRRLAAFFAERDVPCLDLLPAFRAVPDTYAPRDTHWNVAGNHLAARQIAPWLAATALNKH